mgnify:CR=1 FL=1
MDRPDERLPANFWSAPRITAALAVGDIVTILAEIQRTRNWTQKDLGHVLGYSQSWVSKVVRRRQKLSIDQMRDIARRLGVPLHLLRVGRPGDEDPAKRREFGKALAFAPLILTIGPAPKRVEADETTAPMLTSITGAQRRIEATTPARDLARAAVAHLDMANKILGRAAHSEFAQDICAAASEAAGFTAWLHADMRDIGTARRYYRLAIATARKADHPLLAAYMIGSLAAFEIENQDAALGVSLVGEARRTLGDRPPPIAHAWLSSVEALGRASCGDQASALAALSEAEQAVDASERHAAPPWPWVFPFDHGKLAGYRASVMVRLGRVEDAVAAFTESLASVRPSAKQRGVVLTEIAAARCQAGEVDEAFGLAEEALSVGLSYGSERIIHHVRVFRRNYSGPVTTAVREFDDKLRATLI